MNSIEKAEMWPAELNCTRCKMSSCLESSSALSDKSYDSLHLFSRGWQTHTHTHTSARSLEALKHALALPHISEGTPGAAFVWVCACVFKWCVRRTEQLLGKRWGLVLLSVLWHSVCSIHLQGSSTPAYRKRVTQQDPHAPHTHTAGAGE